MASSQPFCNHVKNTVRVRKYALLLKAELNRFQRSKVKALLAWWMTFAWKTKPVYFLQFSEAEAPLVWQVAHSEAWWWAARPWRHHYRFPLSSSQRYFFIVVGSSSWRVKLFCSASCKRTWSGLRQLMNPIQFHENGSLSSCDFWLNWISESLHE